MVLKISMTDTWAEDRHAFREMVHEDKHSEVTQQSAGIDIRMEKYHYLWTKWKEKSTQ